MSRGQTNFQPPSMLSKKSNMRVILWRAPARILRMWSPEKGINSEWYFGKRIVHLIGASVWHSSQVAPKLSKQQMTICVYGCWPCNAGLAHYSLHRRIIYAPILKLANADVAAGRVLKRWSTSVTFMASFWTIMRRKTDASTKQHE